MFCDITELNVSYDTVSASFSINWKSEFSNSTTDNGNAKFRDFVIKIWSGTKDDKHLEVVETTQTSVYYALKQFKDTYPKYLEVAAYSDSLNAKDKYGRPMNSKVSGIAHWSTSEVTDLFVTYHPEDATIRASWKCSAYDKKNNDFSHFRVQLQCGQRYIEEYTDEFTVQAPEITIPLSKYTLDESEYRLLVTAMTHQNTELGEGASYTFVYDKASVKRDQKKQTERDNEHNRTIEHTGHMADLGFACTNGKDAEHGDQYKANAKDPFRYDFKWNGYGKYTRYEIIVTGIIRKEYWNDQIKGYGIKESRTDAKAMGIVETHTNDAAATGYILISQPGTYLVQLAAHDGPDYILSSREYRLEVLENSLKPLAPLDASAAISNDGRLVIRWKEPEDHADFYRAGYVKEDMKRFLYPERTEDGSASISIIPSIKMRNADTCTLERVRAFPANEKEYSNLSFKTFAISTNLKITK